jgi:hypothetical protein
MSARHPITPIQLAVVMLATIHEIQRRRDTCPIQTETVSPSFPFVTFGGANNTADKRNPRRNPDITV